ncbi:class I SAM-dependent methyltransferase [Piscinibacter terrae]|uniref:SAM-dependent methyltransferase n=1 Tax=Piscinibacter terrae TaxID=2496871 RepID=A0A3N7HLT3_9BURK|nr:SAM-dependent methyltransferase [Albitalea terrae]RQP23087.1 SAM-dependent methyltransferase [Albitalea terrae]
MPGFLTKHERVAIGHVDDLHIRSLLDRQQFSDARGEAAAIGICDAAWPLFGLLWPSGRQLAAQMAVRPVRVDERIIEIGCGLGLASLVSHRRGADITASDCHPSTAGFLAENLRLNGLLPLPYQHSHWAVDVGPLRRFDLIIGSDVLYERDDDGVLAGFIERNATTCAEVMLVDPDRGNRSAFSRRMRGLGFELTESRLDDPLAEGGPYKGRLLVYRRSAASPTAR